MAGERRRPHRVAAAIRQEIATFLADHAKDPRIVGLVTVTGVEVTDDLREARVFVSVMGSDVERASTFQGLDSLATHLRAHLGRALRLRAAPAISFRHDESVAHAAHIESLLARVRDGRADDEESGR